MKKTEQTFDDHDIMPYGHHKGTKMMDVPAEYLLWLQEEGKATSAVLDYIVTNRPALLQECETKKKR